MNKTKIEYVDYTWNPIVGCKNGCFYCYAKRINDRFKIIANWENPVFRTNELQAPLKLKKPARILVCSMADLFGDWIPREWIEDVLEIVEVCPEHLFLFLTKNHRRYLDFSFPIQFLSNCMLGLTVTGQFPITWFKALKEKGYRNFVSFEPLFNDLHYQDDLHSDDIWRNIHWVIIGAMTGAQSQKYQPKVEWINNILKEADRYKLPVFMKDNLKKVWKGELRREFPE